MIQGKKKKTFILYTRIKKMLLQTSMKQHKQCKMSKNKPKEYKSKQFFFFIFILKKIANQTYMIKNSFIPKQKKKKNS